MKNKLIIFIAISLVIVLVLFGFVLYLMKNTNSTSINTIISEKSTDVKVNLSDLSMVIDGEESEIKTYTQDDFEQFVSDFNSNNLPEIYVTEFLYDGVGMVLTPDLDDFVEEESNDAEIKTLSITAINVNTTGDIEFTGEITGGMIAVNTNNVSGDINLILNGVKIDTDSKKAPVVYVYNKDITYTGCKVTIKTVKGTENYLEGGKFKKVSLVGSDELSDYTEKYSEDAKTNYEIYTNYYGIYTKEEIENILFAKVQADKEDLADGDPYYFYKGAGAISSDIDLYFEGEGYLSVISKNKEGIETKGNLSFVGKTGDYYIFAEDDCLNTTTSSSENKNARNDLSISVNSLIAKVDSEADEGDSIDSNGTLTIDSGLIIAIAHPTSQDDGLDSEKGTYINGGTVVATGNMSDGISNESKQNVMKLNFSKKQEEGSIVCITDENGKPLIAYKSDRTYAVLTISSPELKEGAYNVYVGGEIEGEETEGLYTNITNYTGGTKQEWNGSGQMRSGGMGGQTRPQMPEGTEDKELRQMPDGQTPPELAEGVEKGERPNPPQEQEGTERQEPPQRPDSTNQNEGQEPTQMPNGEQTTGEASTEFIISGSSNMFNNVKDVEE